MAEKNTAVFGMYPDRITTDEAVDAFRRAGFRTTDLSFLQPENAGTKDLAHEKHTKAPEGAVTGMVIGGIACGVLAWAASMGMFANATLRGMDQLIAAGPTISALAGLGVGAVLGVLIGSLIGMAFPEYEARSYQGRVRNRGVLFSVHCDNAVWAKRARKLLLETGSTHIAVAGESKADFASSDKPHHRRVTVGI